MIETKTKRQAKILRLTRKIHRALGAFLFVFFFIVAVSGLLLGWKKHTGGVILAKSYAGKSTNPQDWLPVHVLQEKANRIAREQISPDLPLELDRIDIRPDKGMVKFVFINGYWGIQLDCTTGELLHIERRRADFIENIHDGSILDYLLGMKDGELKLVYTSVTGFALLTFTITGFWLWFGPKRMRAARNRH
ncbi:MAG TPA: PepSY-associated TM helix domain-containing protein [Pyrinomonadaceae bacterium]|nr:PepSY-associated TM helix domain-containing protein [Pyrinomonadaceae bacterium]